jgi:exopolysaccharide biosynthesis polyprenyl glycosylphosphotransferase
MEVTPMSADAPTALGAMAEPAAALPLEVAGARRRSGRLRLQWTLTCLGVDCATLGAAAVASMVGANEGGIAWGFSPWTVSFCLLALLLFQHHGLYRLRIGIPLLDDVRRVAVCISVAAMSVLTARLLVERTGAASELVRPWVFALVYVVGGRVALYWSQTKARVAGDARRSTLVLGAGRVGRVVARRLLARPELGLGPVAFLDSGPLLEHEGDELELPLAGGFDELDDAIERYGAEHLIVTFADEPDSVMLALANRAESLGVTVSIVPRLFEKIPERITVEHLGGLPLVTAHPSNPRGVEMAIKYALDRIVAAALLLLTGPVFVASALGVYLTMGRPIFFRQPRVGVDGRVFDMLKFRSMRQAPAAAGIAAEADIEWLASQLGEHSGAPVEFDAEHRRTPVGSLLRRTSLDELPQLLNVLRGEMSLVGPRPERVSYVERLEPHVYRYGDRHRVKSGITGWAQVNGLRGSTSLADRVEWDNFYIENFSLWLDLKIVALTVVAVIKAYRNLE